MACITLELEEEVAVKLISHITSLSELKRLASHHSVSIRKAVADSKNLFYHPKSECLPEYDFCQSQDLDDIFAKLSKDSHPSVRFALIKNSLTPTSVIKQLLSDRNPDVRAAANFRLSKSGGSSSVDSSAH